MESIIWIEHTGHGFEFFMQRENLNTFLKVVFSFQLTVFVKCCAKQKCFTKIMISNSRKFIKGQVNWQAIELDGLYV